MNNNYFNSSPEEKRKQDDDMYQKFVVLGLVPLFIYMMWPFIFGTKNTEVQPEIVKERIAKVEENVQEQVNIDESTLIRQERTAPVAVPPKPKRPNKTNKVQPGTIKKTPAQRNNTFALTYNPGDAIEYITQPQNTGWKGVVEGKQNGNYTVKITKVLLANNEQQYLATNNPCNGGKPIGVNAVNQIITVPGRCIHGK